MSVASRAKQLRRSVPGVEAHKDRDVLALHYANAQGGESCADAVGRLEKEVARRHIDDVTWERAKGGRSRLMRGLERESREQRNRSPCMSTHVHLQGSNAETKECRDSSNEWSLLR
jgi:hypothetical protein